MSEPTRPTFDDTVELAAAAEKESDSGEAEPQFTPGTLLGRYVLVSLLGRGGMSLVYLAYDPDLDRRVALKVMRAGRLGTHGRARLLREAQALARLSHPNVVPVYDVGTVGDEAFVAMEYVEGQTLRQWLKDEKRPWRQVLDVMLEAGRGLASAHAAGIVHRDVKPDNVLLGNDGRVRVVDFGLARSVGELEGGPPSGEMTPSGTFPPAVRTPQPISEGHSLDTPAISTERHNLEMLTRADHIVGTPEYMAPEQRRKRSPDERADQFSFCVTLYEALYGRRPFGAQARLPPTELPTVLEKRTGPQGRHEAAQPPRDAGVPAWVERAVLRGLLSDPSSRFPSMSALLRELGRDPAIALRRRLFIAGALSALVALIAGVTFTVGAARRREREMCQGGEARMASVWGPQAKDEIKRAFVALGVPYAEPSAAAFTRGLDAYAREWTAARQEACEATRVVKEQSEEVMDLRMSCLDERLAQVSALVDVMHHPDLDVLRSAAGATEPLPRVAECGDVAALRDRTPRPKDPAQAARIETLFGRLAQVQAQYAVGKNSETMRLSASLLEELGAVDFAPLTAQTELWHARAAAQLGEVTVSVPGFRSAFTWALRARDDRLLAEAAMWLSQEYLYAQELDNYTYWDTVARAALQRTSGDLHIEHFLDQLHCMSLHWSGKVRTRLECMRAHARNVERSGALSEWEISSLGVAATEVGELEEAIGYLRRGVEQARNQYGDDHPRTLEMRGYLCRGQLELGDYASALSECKDALVRLRKVAPDETRLIAATELYVGQALVGLSRSDEARNYFAAVKRDGDEELKGFAIDELAKLDSVTGELDASIIRFRESLEEDIKPYGKSHPNVISDRLNLAAALLLKDKAVEAESVLAPALTDMDEKEISPLSVAQVKFTYAKALAAAQPAARAKAIEIARRALELHRGRAPRTERFRRDEAAMEAWIAAR